MGMFSEPGIVPVFCSSWGSRVSIRMRSGVGCLRCEDIWGVVSTGVGCVDGVLGELGWMGEE